MKCLQVNFVLGLLLLIQIGDSYSETDVEFSPNHYDVTLRLITDDKTKAGKPFTAPGKITIDGVSNIKTDKLKLTVGRDMEINSRSIIIKSVENKTTLFTVKNVTDEHRGSVIQLTPEIQANQSITIYLEFVTPIHENCEKWGGPGSHICYSNGTTDKALFTAAEPSNMIPSFYSHRDGKRKATLRLKLIRPNELNSTVGNTRVESSVPDPEYPGWTIDTLKKTKVISLDEFVFASTNYGYLEKTFGKSKSFRLYAPNDDFTSDKNKLETLSKNTVTVLNFLEEYYDQPQRVPKLDAVLSPVLLSMVPWGINVIYKDYPSTYYPVDMDLFNLFAQVTPVQWLDDVFTTNNDLVGGIINFVMYKTQLATDKKNGNFELGKNRNVFLASRSPLSSGGIWSLMESYFGEETVKKGLLNYVRQGLNSEEGLHTTLQAAANDNGQNLGNLTVATIYKMWMKQEGYPLLRVGSTPDGKMNVSLEAVQTRDEASNEVVSSNSKWTVPLKFKQNLKKADETLVLIDTQEKTKIVNANLHDWVKSGGRGYYRTLFDDNATQWIQQQLESDFNSFDPLTRAYLLQDYATFAKQGFVSYSTTLNLMKYINNETQTIVSNEFVFLMEELHKKFLFYPDYAVIKNYTSKKLGDLWKSAAAADYPKSDLYKFACNLGESFCYPWAEKHIMKWNATGKLNSVISSTSIPAAMLCSMVASGGKSGFEFIVDEYEKSLLSQNNPRNDEFGDALACVTDERLVQELLNKTTTKTFKQVLPSLAEKEIGQALVLPFLSANLEEQVKNKTQLYEETDDKPWNLSFVSTVIYKLSQYMSTEKQLKELEDFIKTHEKSVDPIKYDLKEHVERVKRNILWMDKQGKDIVKWVKLQ